MQFFNRGDGVKRWDIGFVRARKLALDLVSPLGVEELALSQAVDCVLAEPVRARVNAPSTASSTKDGYAVFSGDTAAAGPEHPVSLEVIDHVAAGGRMKGAVKPGQAVRILTGAPIPEGADAVLAEEFADIDGKWITARADAGPGRNVQAAGADVSLGEPLAEAGQKVTPQLVGLFTAGGISTVRVFKKPRVGLLATGSEIELPGRPLTEGRLYASNAALQQAWLLEAGMPVELLAAADEWDDISDALCRLHASCDVVLTSGGAWKGDRDLVVKVLEKLGWEMFFHRTRMGPGKSLGAGRLDDKPVFCLPGGPASNEIAFTMIVFPALLKMAGFTSAPYLSLTGRLAEAVFGRPDWTQFIPCDIAGTRPEIVLKPARIKSRMAGMNRTPAVLRIPEGVETIEAGAQVRFLCLDRRMFEWPID